jgi:hypothetical protein
MRLSFSYHWSFSSLRVAVAVSEQPARANGSGGFGARPNRAESGTGLCSGGRAALKSMFATVVWQRTNRLVPVCDELEERTWYHAQECFDYLGFAASDRGRPATGSVQHHCRSRAGLIGHWSCDHEQCGAA